MIAILVNIRSLHNVGSMFRTSDAAGVKKMYLCGITPAPVNRFKEVRPQIAKVALGGEKSVEWEKVKSVTRLIQILQKDGYTVIALEQSKQSIPYFKFSGRKKKIALVVGNEVKGLSKSVLNHVDKVVEIPMHGKKESLNVSVAFGVLAFHITRLVK